MTENWDVYFCTVDDRPASILVNLGCGEFAPMPGYPFMGYISLEVREPDENGFPGPGEFDELNALEDGLEAALSAGEKTVYVGRCATDGRLDFFYYLQSGEGWIDSVADFMDASSGHVWDAGSAPDQEWSCYLEFLFPGERDMLAIQNRRACQRLRKSGDDTARARAIDHWLAFADEAAAAAFSAAAGERGYQVERVQNAPGQEGAEDGAEDGAQAPGRSFFVHGLRLSRTDAPDDIDAVSFTLAELAEESGGRYRGWSSPVTPKDEG